MLTRVPEPELMDTAEDAADYDRMDHAAVNAAFAADFLAVFPRAAVEVLDVGTGPARIPIELCRRSALLTVVAVDAAEAMLAVARANVADAGLTDRVRLEVANARRLPFADGAFAAVVSNSLIHHLHDVSPAFAELARVRRPGGRVFVRDLARPADEAELAKLVERYAAGATARQRQLFADSLRAALTADEVRAEVGRVGFPPGTVQMTSDRHWTWSAAGGGQIQST